MPFTTGIQLSLELTKVFGVAVNSAKDILDVFRQFRNSGSDILVEEDLACIFGRGRIDNQLEQRFRKEVTIDHSRTQLHSSSDLSLHPGPGPTLNRAMMRNQGRQHLSTVIQLSFLSWSHEKEALATSLTQCMDQRMRLGLPDAKAEPGFDSVLGTLEACNSQTSSFSWNPYITEVKRKIQQHFCYYEYMNDHRHLQSLSNHVLLAAMDFLYLVQSLPEDRILEISSEDGVVPIVVWAHHILGLTVSIRSSLKEDLVFGDAEMSQVIVLWLGNHASQEQNFAKALLLDKDMNVVLREDSELLDTRISSEERHSLRNYGSTHLRQALNEGVLLDPGPQVFAEVIEVILALTILASQRVIRETVEGRTTGSPRRLELWQIRDATQVIFQDLKYDTDRVPGTCGMLKDQSGENFPIPRSAELHFEKTLPGRNKSDLSSFRQLIGHLSNFLLVFSYVRDVQSCADIPLAFSRFTLMRIVNLTLRRCGKMQSAIRLKEDTLFMTTAQFLKGIQISKADYENAFLISDFGWSIHLDCIGDNDPAGVSPEILHVKKGVPTHDRTSERRMRVEDAPDLSGNSPCQEVIDRGETYLPRCATQVVDRAEYFASKNDVFILRIRFRIDGYSTQMKYDEYASYRLLHTALWQAHVTEPCEHLGAISTPARLGLNIVTVKGLSYSTNSMPKLEQPHHPERIHIILVKGDQRLRWLAAKECIESQERQAMIRSDGCCENCALDAAAGCPGDWNVVL